MVVINGQWILARLTGKRGEKAALARALGISPDKLSRIIAGERDVQPEEVSPLLKFFGEGLGAGENPLTDEERVLVEDYRRIQSTHLRESIRTLAKQLADPQDNEQSSAKPPADLD